MNKNSKILITGASGLIGSAMLRRLSSQQYENVTVVSNNREIKKYNCTEYNKIKADLSEISKKEMREIVRDNEYVFHFAAATSGAKDMEDNPLVHVNPNVIMNTMLLDCCYKAGVKKVIWTSSSTIYPDSTKAMLEEDGFLGDPFKKYFPVGWMKRYTEKLCEMYSNYLPRKMPCVVLRPSNIYGPGDKFDLDKCHVTPAMVKKVVDKWNPLEVWGDGNDMRDLLYVDDFIDAVFLAMDINEYNPINICSEKLYSVNDIISILMEIESYYPKIIYSSDKPTMIKYRAMNGKKAREILGFNAKTSIENGLKATANWYKHNER